MAEVADYAKEELENFVRVKIKALDSLRDSAIAQKPPIVAEAETVVVGGAEAAATAAGENGKIVQEGQIVVEVTAGEKGKGAQNAQIVVETAATE